MSTYGLPSYLVLWSVFRMKKLENLPHIAVSQIYPDINILVDESSTNFLNDTILFIHLGKKVFP